MPDPHSPSALPGLALAGLLLTASAAGADVTRVDRSAFLGATSLADGVFDAPPGIQEDGFSKTARFSDPPLVSPIRSAVCGHSSSPFRIFPFGPLVSASTISTMGWYFCVRGEGLLCHKG